MFRGAGAAIRTPAYEKVLLVQVCGTDGDWDWGQQQEKKASWRRCIWIGMQMLCGQKTDLCEGESW